MMIGGRRSEDQPTRGVRDPPDPLLPGPNEAVMTSAEPGVALSDPPVDAGGNRRVGSDRRRRRDGARRTCGIRKFLAHPGGYTDTCPHTRGGSNAGLSRGPGRNPLLIASSGSRRRDRPTGGVAGQPEPRYPETAGRTRVSLALRGLRGARGAGARCDAGVGR